MSFMEKFYRDSCHFFMALASTSLLPAIYFVKIGYEVFQTNSVTVNRCLDLMLFLGVPVIMSLCSLRWMQLQGKDSINNGVQEIAPVNHEYLPVYLGYIFVSLSLPVLSSGEIDWITLGVIYLLICLFVTCSKTLCFNPLFIIFGFGYYQITTTNGIKVFVITKRRIRKGDERMVFPSLRKVNELVYLETIDTDK